MEKNVFEMPEMQVTLFEESDILTLSPGDSENIPEIKW